MISDQDEFEEDFSLYLNNANLETAFDTNLAHSAFESGWLACAEQNDAKWIACVERKNKVIDEQAAEIKALQNCKLACLEIYNIGDWDDVLKKYDLIDCHGNPTKLLTGE